LHLRGLGKKPRGRWGKSNGEKENHTAVAERVIPHSQFFETKNTNRRSKKKSCVEGDAIINRLSGGDGQQGKRGIKYPERGKRQKAL